MNPGLAARRLDTRKVRSACKRIAAGTERAMGPGSITATGTLASPACAVLPEGPMVAYLTIAGTRRAVSRSLDAQARILVAFRDPPI